ncbi:UDP-N-acetyl-D-glucosamine 6-dehydrogenase [Poriferisphaera corsica]|uniref:UDP-N-acetyl-D-glucosamine 6-dehydrogenase n=1 Tax=Poriferisphaera corsica TaxID=2528020 RepID=A0A517YZA2_9BACT|nr:nucleotide sugar dehydrogenase [Poriferisphaera corsica]QDU35555.1 UDP-N-acetyl-D-glucosamine 6-dehydrogenase [Poriferisphaera corsica]
MNLNDAITQKSARIGIVGLGYVGLPLLRAFYDAGFSVLGFDVDPAKIEMLNRGENYLKHLGENLVSDMLTAGSNGQTFDSTADMSRMGEADALLLCVPTPLGKHMDPDLSYVEDTTRLVAKTLRPDQLIVLESTTYPGTTRDVMLPILEETGLKHGEFYLAYSPEREDPGRKSHNTQTIPKLVGGLDKESTDLAVELYKYAISDIIPVSSAEVAESAKILENVYRSVNIALVNEMKIILTAMDIDVWEVIDAAATKPFGFQAFYPGPGLGGHCIPIDPFYLTWKAKEVGKTTRFIELAGQVNHEMPSFVVQRTMLALNDHGKALKTSKILILGLAYKPDVDDVRESPSFELIEQLEDLGATVDYNDPHVPATHKMRHYPNVNKQSVELSAESLAGYDAILIATNHAAYDYEFVAKNAKLIIDTRGAMRQFTDKYDNIVSA